MSIPLDEIICGDNCDVLGGFPRECIDTNADYCEIALKRIEQQLLFGPGEHVA